MNATKEAWYHNDVAPYYIKSKSISGEERIVVKEVESLADAELICMMQNQHMSDLRFYTEKQDLKRALYDLYVNDAKENSDHWNAVLRNNGDGTLSMYTFEEFRMLHKEIVPVWSMLRNNSMRKQRNGEEVLKDLEKDYARWKSLYQGRGEITKKELITAVVVIICFASIIGLIGYFTSLN